MDRAGALELIMRRYSPPSSGRNRAAGAVRAGAVAIQGPHDREFVYGPTFEEVITDIARRELRSYKQLPVNFYQIQSKFRDEIRPRFGVMRARDS